MRERSRLRHENPDAYTPGYLPGISSTHYGTGWNPSGAPASNKAPLRWKARTWQDRPVPMPNAEDYVPTAVAVIKNPARQEREARLAAWKARNPEPPVIRR